MSVTPTTIRHVPGQFDSVTVFLSSLNGFSGGITLSVLGKIRTYDFNNVVLSSGATGSVTITLADVSAPAGIFTEVILGRSAGIVHSVSVTLISQPSLICIAPDGASSCGETPSIISGPSPSSNSQLRVAVVLDGSPPQQFYGFDITLLTNHTILRPAGFDLTGTILQDTWPVLVDCIGGVSKNRIVCPSTDTLDTLEIAAIGRSPSLGYPGLLFTAIYNITGSSSETPIAFQVGCTNTSVKGGACVTIASGTPFPITEDVQSGGFSNLPSFALNAGPGLLSIQRGTTDFSTVSLSGLNNFSGNITISTKLSSTGVAANVSPASLLLTPDFPTEQSFLTLTIGNEAPPGNYTISVVATSGLFSQSIILALIVPTPDFVLSVARHSFVASAGELTTNDIFIVSEDTFAGNVSLTIASPTGLDSKLSMTTVMVPERGVGQSSMILFPRFQGGLQVNITAASGNLSHEIIVTVIVPGFFLDIPCFCFALTLLEGSATSVPVAVHSESHYNGTVTLAESVTPSIGLSFTCPASSLVVNQPGVDSFEFCSLLGSNPGNYTITITGTSGILTHSFQIPVFVAKSPLLIQFHGKHRVSLSRADNTATFFAGIYNPNNSTALFAQVRVFVYPVNAPALLSDSMSSVLTLPPLAKILNIPIPVLLRGLFANPPTGEYNFNVEIDWWSGTTFGQIPLTSVAATQGISTQGTFAVIA